MIKVHLHSSIFHHIEPKKTHKSVEKKAIPTTPKICTLCIATLLVKRHTNIHEDAIKLLTEMTRQFILNCST